MHIPDEDGEGEDDPATGEAAELVEAHGRKSTVTFQADVMGADEEDEEDSDDEDEDESHTASTTLTGNSVIISDGEWDESREEKKCSAPHAPSGSVVTFEDDIEAQTTRGSLPCDEEFCGLEWRDLHFTVFNSREGAEKQILFGINGRLRKGQLLGILGGSGAGKSTFLNILSGRLLSNNLRAKDWWFCKKAKISSTKVSGSVAYEKKAFSLGESDAIKGISAYVMQSDILCAAHTPKEALTFSAKLRLPYKMPNSEKLERVDAVVASLKLEKCQNTLIGDEAIRGVSGGERKRTSVGVELVTDPDVVFLDEPTSGLDSFTAKKTVDMLHTLCKDGKMVIATLHQPSADIFLAMDKLLLLAKGYVVYSGTPKGAVRYFKSLGEKCPNHANPADFCVNLIQANPQKFIDAWKNEEKRQSEKTEDAMDFSSYGKLKPSAGVEAPFWYQSALIGQREWAIFTRDPRPSRLRLAQTIAFGLLIGMLYWNMPHNQGGLRDRFGLCFFLSVNCALLGIITSIITFPQQRLLIERERNNYMYNTTTYLLSKAFIQIPEAVLFSLISAVIVYWMVGADSHFWQFYLVLMLGVNCGGSMGILVGCFAQNASEAMQLMPTSFVPQLLFANFLVSIKQIPIFLRWIQWLDLFRYMVDALVITEFKHTKYKQENGQGFTTGDAYLKSLGVDADDLHFNYIMLAVLIVGFRVLSWLILVRRIGF